MIPMKRNSKYIKTLLLAAAFGALSFAYIPNTAAQNKNNKEPLEISADGTLEWHRNDNMYIARGKAVAAQGNTTIKAQVLEAYYREPKKGGMEIWKIIAKDQVEIDAPNGRAFGDKAVYNLDDAKAVMTGKTLKMTSDGQVLTATERFEYFTQQSKLVAIGNAKIVRPAETLESENMTAWFKDGQDTRELSRAEADGNVVITTAEEKITGNKGIYQKDENKAEILGDVVITRGPNILKGTRAELDLLTNISRIFGGETSDGDTRVRGTFYPDSADEKAAQ